MMDYNVCRYCKYFEKGCCINRYVYSLDETSEVETYKFSEDGTLAEAIKEGIGAVKFKDFEQALFESKISKKAAKELLSVLYGEFEDITANLIEQIDESVSKALDNYDFNDGDIIGVEVLNPGEHSCKGFF